MIDLKLYAKLISLNKISMQNRIVNIFSHSCLVLLQFGRFAGSAPLHFSLQ